MEPTEADLLQLIGLIYDAAENPPSWSAFLERHAQVFDASVTLIQWHRFARHSSTLLAVFGVSPRLRSSYAEYYSGLNVWRERGRQKYVPGRVLLDEEICPRPDLVRSEFYNDYLQPLGGVYGASAVIAREREDALVLTSLRGGNRHPFGRSERHAMEVLLPHLTRAHAIQQRLQLLDAGQSLLDTLDVGVAFVTATLQLLSCNRAAETILQADDGLSIRDGVLHAPDASAASRLREAVREAVAAQPALNCGAAVAVPRLSCRRPYHVIVGPFRHGSPAFGGMRAPEAMLVLVDSASHRPTATDTLKQLYGLTAREAALAAALSTGKTLEEVAADLQVTYETARTHLRRVFDKTNTSRQTELVMLLARLPRQTPSP